jgi:hypothetical protein
VTDNQSILLDDFRDNAEQAFEREAARRMDFILGDK